MARSLSIRPGSWCRSSRSSREREFDPFLRRRLTWCDVAHRHERCLRVISSATPVIGGQLHVMTRSERWILVVCLLGGVLLTVIGIRYLLVPESAARAFGVPGRPAGYELHTIIGLRNVWLG